MFDQRFEFLPLSRTEVKHAPSSVTLRDGPRMQRGSDLKITAPRTSKLCEFEVINQPLKL